MEMHYSEKNHRLLFQAKTIEPLWVEPRRLQLRYGKLDIIYILCENARRSITKDGYLIFVLVFIS